MIYSWVTFLPEWFLVVFCFGDLVVGVSLWVLLCWGGLLFWMFAICCGVAILC